MTASRYIKIFLRLSDIKQVDVAMIIGVERSAVNHYINGNRPLKAEFALKLEKILPGFSAKKALYLQADEELKQAKMK